MTKIFYPTSERLKFLLASIHNREIALPDFQRDFVWDPGATEELIESILQNFPAGSLLRIKNSKGFYFAPREFAGAPPLDGHAPSYLILDGQQRLTSLYQALYGAGSHRYFIDLQGLREDGDLEDCVDFLRKRDGEKQFGTMEQQAATLTLPVQVVFGEQGGFEEWLDQVLELRTETEDQKKHLKQELRALRKRWLDNIDNYEFPMVTLADDTKAAAVCTIFETLNRTGVKLSVFDLLAARFWPEEVRLRDLWDQARAEDTIISDFEVDPYYVLQSLSLFTGARGYPSCKRGDVLQMTVDQIRAGWGSTVKGLADSLRILREDCGVILPNWLPYYPMLVTAAAALATTEDLKGPQVAAVRNKLIRWFWCSVFGQAYEKASNSQAAKDFMELKQWFRGGEQPDTVKAFSFDAATLRETTPRQRGIYRGIIALILRNGALDFHQGSKITAGMMLEEKIEDHHVFPQAFLQGSVTATARDCVLNRTLIDKKTNIRIGKQAPSVYLEEIRQEVGDSVLRSILRSHLLPADTGASLLTDRFDDFLADRQKLIETQLRAVTQ